MNNKAHSLALTPRPTHRTNRPSLVYMEQTHEKSEALKRIIRLVQHKCITEKPCQKRLKNTTGIKSNSRIEPTPEDEQSRIRWERKRKGGNKKKCG